MKHVIHVSINVIFLIHYNILETFDSVNNVLFSIL
jgi:hypothetical protein